MMAHQYQQLDCLEAIVYVIDHHCLEVIVHVVNIGGIVNHHCLEAIVHVVVIGGMVVNNSTNIKNMNNRL
jgi:hypothetical protein